MATVVSMAWLYRSINLSMALCLNLSGFISLSIFVIGLSMANLSDRNEYGFAVSIYLSGWAV